MTEESKRREQVRFRRISEFGGLDMLEARYHRQRFARHVHETFALASSRKAPSVSTVQAGSM